MAEKRNSDLRLLWRLLKTFIRPYWTQLTLLVFAYFVASLLTAFQPMVTAPVLEIAVKGPEAFSQLNETTLTLSEIDLNNVGQYLLNLFFPQKVGAWQVIVTIALVYLLISVTLYIINFFVYLLGIWIRVRAGRDMQLSLFSHVTGLSLDFFHSRRTGELISRLDKDTDAVIFGLEESTRNLIVSSVLVIFYGALLIKTSLRLSLIVAIAAGLQYLFIQAIRRPLKTRVREQFNVQAEVTAYLQEVISNIRVLKSFVAEKYEQFRLRNLTKRAVDAKFRFSFIKNVDEPTTFIINSTVNVVILLFATNELLSGGLSTTGFFLYLYVGRSVLGPLTNLARTLKSIQTTIASSERVQEFFAEKPLVSSGTLNKAQFENKIVFENVSFWHDQHQVLKNINLEINKGQVVALVGHSGAGKSTLIDLILRFYDPQEGRITIDSEDLRELNLDTYRRMFGVVPQDSILFNTSVISNIAYPTNEDGEGSTTQEYVLSQVERAARLANAHEFVLALPQGYQTLVGDRGVLLSGGQKQRITIARAVYHQPQILILDEATSSLDTESERLVQKAIEKAVRGTTAIVIAHRLSTVMHADKIVVIDQGRIIDEGTHNQLLDRCDIYKRLCDVQFESDPIKVEPVG